MRLLKGSLFLMHPLRAGVPRDERVHAKRRARHLCRRRAGANHPLNRNVELTPPGTILVEVQDPQQKHAAPRSKYQKQDVRTGGVESEMGHARRLETNRSGSSLSIAKGVIGCPHDTIAMPLTFSKFGIFYPISFLSKISFSPLSLLYCRK